jgi:DNA-binding FadR family transcriptional regulator
MIKTDTGSASNRCEEVVAALKREILMQQYTPGDSLPPEEVLAQKFEVSRAMVREALGILKAQGYLESRRGKNGGTFVKNILESGMLGDLFGDLILMGKMKIAELFAARLLIEPEAARIAALHASSIDLQKLSDINDMVSAARTQEERIRHNVTFHITLGQLSGNPFYDISIRSFMGFTQMFAEILGYTLPYVHNDAAHVEILEALAVRNPQLAFERMYVHVSGMKSAMSHQEKLFRDARLS